VSVWTLKLLSRLFLLSRGRGGGREGGGWKSGAGWEAFISREGYQEKTQLRKGGEEEVSNRGSPARQRKQNLSKSEKKTKVTRLTLA